MPGTELIDGIVDQFGAWHQIDRCETLAFALAETKLPRVTEAELPIYQLLGEETIAAMVRGFYRRVPTDPILGPMYPPHDLAGAEHRLRGFLIYRFGGPTDYLAERGHPRLRARHAPFVIDAAARDRWMELILASIDELGIAPDLRAYLERFLGGIATFLINRGA